MKMALGRLTNTLSYNFFCLFLFAIFDYLTMYLDSVCCIIVFIYLFSLCKKKKKMQMMLIFNPQEKLNC